MVSELTHYPVYLSVHIGSGKFDHHLIFIHTNYNDDENPKGGYKLHVVGTLQKGMAMELKKMGHPFETPTCRLIQHKGWMRHRKLEKAREICSGVPPPAKQFDGPRRLAGRGPLRHCQHWVAEAFDAMRAEGVLEPLGEGDIDEIIYRP